MKIIGINGRAKSGKDTAFNIIADNVPFARREGFADRMKLSGVLALGYAPENMEQALEIANRLKDNGQVISQFINGEPTFGKRSDGTLGYSAQMQTTPISGRTFWQLYGTEAHRHVFGDDFWVDALLPRPPISYIIPVELDKAQDAAIDALLRQTYPDVPLLVITDCRFPNEAERILSLNGEVWRIEADERLGKLPPDAHISEYGLPDELVTRVIDNNGPQEAFIAAVTEIVEEGL